jgi:predicted metal-binding protein
MGDRITVCATCREGAGARLAERLGAALGGTAEVRLADCLFACSSPLALAVSGEGKATYLFAGLDPEGQAGEVLAFAGLFREAPLGEVADARPCGRLRFCLLGRIPA